MSARDDADARDAVQLDRFPACPHCGNLCGRLARICVDCGTALLLTAASLDYVTMPPAREGEAVAPANGTEA